MLFMFAGCNIVEEIITSPEIDLRGNGYCEVPQLTIQQLDNLTNIYTNSVYWRVSKGCSVLEMSAFAGMEGFDGAILAERPVIIYGWDGVPKYFEWRVFKNGDIVGAIVASASKLICRPVAYVLRMVSSYGLLTNFPTDTVIIDDDYPDFVFGKIDTNAKCVTEALDPFAGTNIGVKKEIFTLMQEKPELFYSNVLDQAQLILFTELYPLYSIGWWDNIDEAQMIAVSYLGPLAVSSNKFTPLVQDWESGRVVDGFTGLSNGGWWDMDWVENHLLWNPNSYYYTNYGGWCGPTAGAIMMTYYGYTNKIRWYTYNITNIYYYYATTKKSTNFQFVLDKIIDLKGLPTSMKLNILFDSPSFWNSGNPNSDSISYVSGGAIPQDYPFTTGMMYTGCHYSAPYYYFEHNFSYSAQQVYDHLYTRFLLSFDVFVSNRNPGLAASPILLSGIFVFKRDGWPWTYETVRTEYFSYELFQYIVSTNTLLNLNPMEWVFLKSITNIKTYTNDGYYRFGWEMGIRDWNNGGVELNEFKTGLLWSCNNAMDFNTTYFNSWSWFINIVYPDIYNWEAFRDAINCIDKNDVIAIARFWYWNDGKLIDSHWRIGVGYKESDYGKYILITDNGAESKHQNVSGRTFINSITDIYCPYILWENTETMGYDYRYTAYKK